MKKSHKFPKISDLYTPLLTGVYYKGFFQYNIQYCEEFMLLQLWALETKETENINFLFVNSKGKSFQIGLNSKGELEKWPSGMADIEQKTIAALVRLRRDLQKDDFRHGTF